MSSAPAARPSDPLPPPADDLTPSPGPNLFVAAARRWPWVAVGLAAGLVGGFLYHTQKPSVYQSSADLLVRKNRSGQPAAGGPGDSRIEYVEDFVSPQVVVVRSQLVADLAAKRVNPAEFRVPPGPTEAERAAFMRARLGAAKSKEASAGVLNVTFSCGDPADARKYLLAVIDAYQGVLNGAYSEVSEEQMKALEGTVQAARNRKSGLERDREEEQRKMYAVTQEDPAGVRSRITTNRSTQVGLKLRQATLAGQLDQIKEAGTDRAKRAAAAATLSAQARRAGGEARGPEDVLTGYEIQRAELAQRYGKDHPEMQALDNKIRGLRLMLARLTPDDPNGADELAVIETGVRFELKTIAAQLAQIGADLDRDERMMIDLGKHQGKLDALTADVRKADTDIQDATAKLAPIQNTVSSSGFKVQPLNPPGDGYQVAPVLSQSLLLGALLGLAAGGGLAFLAEFTDRGFRNPAEIRRHLGVPVLGHVPRMPAARPAAAPDLDPTLAAFHRPKSAEAEAYRGVRTQLYFSTRGQGHQVVQVTSPNPGDGKSTLAANLAVSIAQSGKRTVLLDCDFRKPRVHKLFRLDRPEVGLASVMAGDADLAAATQPCRAVPNLSLMPCGPRPENPAELLTSPKFQEVVAELREAYDFVVIDSPPVLAVSDPSAVAPRADGVILVFRMTKDARPLAERAREQLQAVGARLIGVVVNATAERSGGYTGYGYGYQYGYQYGYADAYADDDEPAAVPRKG